MALAIRPAVSGAPSRRCISTLSSTPPRQQSQGGASSSSSSRNPDRHRKSAKTSPKRTVSRMLSVDVAKFMRLSDGHLDTTPENMRFFRANPTVDHDHGIMTRLEIRSDYARKAREDALWAFATAIAGDSAVVWQLTKRELLRAVFRSLTSLGYNEHGRKQDGTELRGTLWLTVLQAQHARRLPVESFGEVVADTLDKHYATRPEERCAAAVAGAGEAEKDKRGERELGDGIERRANNTKPWTPRERAVSTGGRRVPGGETEVPTAWRPRKKT
ncbi:hypothetical protein LLEC1_07286 [Akanthomyces lecanii]|uniref:Uncharacterized protein n=1 Tax=Cordyceps confragosa TaxID=2714763 RepID=A0A179IJ25_CORDF|nr:hypothetical protein LLEC1_07286 [Akanthomyces lecanii]